MLTTLHPRRLQLFSKLRHWYKVHCSAEYNEKKKCCFLYYDFPRRQLRFRGRLCNSGRLVFLHVFHIMICNDLHTTLRLLAKQKSVIWRTKKNITSFTSIYIIDDASSIIMLSSNLFCEGAHPTWNSPKPPTWLATIQATHHPPYGMDGSSSPVFIAAKALKNGTLVHRSQGVDQTLGVQKKHGPKHGFCRDCVSIHN